MATTLPAQKKLPDPVGTTFKSTVNVGAPKPPKATTPATTSYGYNTSSKAPFNAYAAPTTVGGLNKQALALAAPSYQPQLDQNTADTAAENAATQQRQSQLTGIYSQYGNQAQQAFNETRDALNQMIAANASGDTQSQAVLKAALSSAAQGQNGLGAMMGISGTPTAQDIAPYMAAAQGSAAGTGSELQALSGGLLSTIGQGVGNAASEGAQQQDLESQRHEAAVQSNQQSRDAIVASIPAAVEKAREQLITDILNAQGLQFQQNLAAKQFGLTEKSTNANIANAAQTLALNKTNAAANRANALTTLQQNQETITNNALAIKAASQKSAVTLANQIAKATSQRQVNSLKYLTTWSAPTAEEINKTTTTDPKTGITTHAGQVNTTVWHRDPANALRTLTVVYGLDLKTALQYLSTVTVPIGQGNNMTVSQWAMTYLATGQPPKIPSVKSHIGKGSLTLPAVG